MIVGSKQKVVFLSGVIAMICLLTVCLSYPAYVFAAGKTAVVTASNINVRSGPGTTYSKVGTVRTGSSLEVLAEKNGWYKLRLPQGKSGWIKGTLLSIKASKVLPGNIKITEKSSATVKTVTVKTNNVNVRSGPGTGFGKVGKVNSGQQYKVIKEKSGWYYLDLGKAKYGWVLGSLVTLKSAGNSAGNTSPPGDGSVPNVPQIPNGSNSYLVIKGSSVNIRVGAGTGYGVVGKVNIGQQLNIIQQKGDWYMVSLGGGKQGWVAGWLAEVRSAETPSRGDDSTSNPPTPKPEKPGTTPGTDNETPGTTPGPTNGTETPAQKLNSIELTSGENGAELLTIKSEGVIKFGMNRMSEPDRLVIDIENCDVNNLSDLSVSSACVARVRVAQYSLTPMSVRVVLDLNKPVAYTARLDNNGQALTVTLSEPSIKGKLIVIDAGHGGYDPGAIGVTGLEEKEFNLDTVLRLCDKLMGMGANVMLTREADSFVSLNERAAVANRVHADVFVSIHANSSKSSALRGSSTYFYAPSSNPALYAQALERRRLAAAIQTQLAARLGTRDIGILQANFAVLRGTIMPSVLVETAFLSNTEDEKSLKDGQFRDNAAQAVADGIVEYFSNPY